MLHSLRTVFVFCSILFYTLLDSFILAVRAVAESRPPRETQEHRAGPCGRRDRGRGDGRADPSPSRHPPRSASIPIWNTAHWIICVHRTPRLSPLLPLLTPSSAYQRL